MEGAPAGQGPHYLVLNRSWADLYAEVAGLFADRSDIRVVVDRRGRERVGGGRVPIGEGRRLTARREPATA